MAKSPRMVPGADAKGLVAPRRAFKVSHEDPFPSLFRWCNILRPVFTASRPSQTIAQMGPLSISTLGVSTSGSYAKREFPYCRRYRTGNEAFVEGLVRQILVVLLEVLFGWCDELYSCQFVAINQQGSVPMMFRSPPGESHPRFSNLEMISPTSPRCCRLD